MNINPLFHIDFYKAGHYAQYPEGTNLILSNFTPRSDRLFKGSKFWQGKVVNFGIEAWVEDYLCTYWKENFFQRPKSFVLSEYKQLMDSSLGPNMVSIDHISDLYDLGYLPLEIRALPEGARSPIKVPVLTVRNTLPEFYWLVNYLETVMSQDLWKPMNSATIAFEYKKILIDAAVRTGCPIEGVAIQGHDFSARGLSGHDDSPRSGAGHLTSFIGTDTVAALPYVQKFYKPEADGPIGVSVPATEHSVMCMGTKDGELETFRRLIEDIYPEGIVSIVSDTWDFWKVITEYLPALKDKVRARKPNGLGLRKVVIRPDSGDPVDILCGTYIPTVYEDIDYLKDDVEEECQDMCGQGCMGPWEMERIAQVGGELRKFSFSIDYIGAKQDRGDKLYSVEEVRIKSSEPHELTPEEKGAVQCLWEEFGGTLTETGHKLLDEVGLIYGDSITLDRCQEICDRLAAKGFASQNVVFGIGSYTYQYVTRDTLGFAMKATYGEVNGEGREIYKDPVTDSGTKKSAKGMVRVVEEDGEYKLLDQQDYIGGDSMETIFCDGARTRFTSIETIRSRLNDEANKGLVS